MSEPDQPKPEPKAQKSGEVIRLDQRLMPVAQPGKLSPADALKVVRVLAADTANIVIINYAKRKTKQRKITRRQIELCVQKGTVVEGPFVNQHGNWQLNLCRHAAGEQITTVVAIEWITRVLVINAF